MLSSATGGVLIQGAIQVVLYKLAIALMLFDVVRQAEQGRTKIVKHLRDVANNSSSEEEE